MPTSATRRSARLIPPTGVDTIVHEQIVRQPGPGMSPRADARHQRDRHAPAACGVRARAHAENDRRARVRRRLRRRAAGAPVLQGGDGAAVPAADALPARRRRRSRTTSRPTRAGTRAWAARCSATSRRSARACGPRSRATSRSRSARPTWASTRASSSCTIDDALEAIVAAVRNPVRGAVNVAGPGTIGLTRMIRLAGKRALPIAAPLFGAVTSTGQRLGLDTQSDDFQRLLRYGRGVDTRGSPTRSGYTPRHSTSGRRDWPACEAERVNGVGTRRARRCATMPSDRDRTSCAGCGPGSTPVSSFPRRSPAAPRRSRATRARPSSGSSTGWTATTRRTSGASTRSFAELVEPLFAFLYETWWRVKVEGAERVPAHGRALLTSNHAGILPWDATMISLALLREHPLPRYPRFLVLDWAFDLPVDLGGDAQGRRRGGVALQRDAAARAGPAGGGLPRGREGHGQAVLGALPAPALRPRRLRGDRAAHRRADRAGGGRRERGDLSEARRPARRWRA